jgi:hypothetical protein
VRSYVANYLLQQQGYQSRLSTAGAALAANRGSIQSLGLPAKSFKSILQSTSGFIVFGAPGSGLEMVFLDTTQLLQLPPATQLPPPIPQPPLPAHQPQLLPTPQPAPEEPQAGPSGSSSQSLRPVQQLLFELQLQQDGSGWLQPSYILHPQQLQQAATEHQMQQKQTVAEAVAGGCQQLVGVRGSQPVLQELDSSSSSSSSSSSGSSYCSYDDGGATAAADETAASMGGEAREEDSAGQQQQESATAANADMQGEGLSVHEGDEEQQEPWAVEGCSSSGGARLGSELSSLEQGPAVHQDEGVLSMARLLPARYAAWSLQSVLSLFLHIDL